MTIFRTLLSKGYFPKELPPAFFTDQFARYATTKNGRLKLSAFKSPTGYTECVGYDLALPGGHRRNLGIPHPGDFARLAHLVARNFRRLLRKAGVSQNSRSRPVYSDKARRAINTLYKPSSLARERTIVRGGAQYVVKIDVSEFYSSLYTHAIGWAIDPKLRHRRYWSNTKLLGKQIDQALVNLQGKITQGIPIGNDISFLLAEIVLGQVDRATKLNHKRAYRWFDDYEIGCNTRDEADQWIATVQSALHKFRLRVNPLKTRVLPLPHPTVEVWQQELVECSKQFLTTRPDILSFAEVAFRLSAAFQDAAVLNYALGLLFRVRSPTGHAASIAQSVVTQAMLSEPGCVQKAIALLTFWALNGLLLDADLLSRTVGHMVLNQRRRGLSSDVAWGLAFCIDRKIGLTKRSVPALVECDDNCIALLALHMRHEELLPATFACRALADAVKAPDFAGPDWLFLYEAHRQGFISLPTSAIGSDPLVSDLLTRKVSFYRKKLPPYASVINPGGAPGWVVKDWINASIAAKQAKNQAEPEGKVTEGEKAPAAATVVQLIAEDVEKISQLPESKDDVIAMLLESRDTDGFMEEDDGSSYPGDIPEGAGE